MGYRADSEIRHANIKNKQGVGMEKIIRLLWVIIVLLVVLIAKDSIPRRVQATGAMDVNIQSIGGSTIWGKTLDVRLVD